MNERKQLKTNRALWKLIVFGGLTVGIYPLVIFTSISKDINTIAAEYDGKKTMNFCLMTFIFSWLTLGIYPLVWYTTISSRIGRELARRGISYNIDGGTFWLWNTLGALIVVGPFVYLHKLCKAINLLAEDYNAKG